MGRWRRLTEGVAPAETGEAAEVEVVGVDLGLVFHCEGGDVSVGDEVAADAGGQQVLLEEGEVVRAGVDGSDVWEIGTSLSRLRGHPEAPVDNSLA